MSRSNLITYLTLGFTILACNGPMKQEIFVLPENYRGAIIIGYGQSNGARPMVQHAKTTYEIPASGVLFVNSKPISEIIKPSLFYMKKGNARLKLDYIEDIKEVRNDTSLVAFSYSLAEFTKEYGSNSIQY